MKKRWLKNISESITPEFEDRVMRAADPELKRLRQVPMGRWAFVSALVGTAIAAIVVTKTDDGQNSDEDRLEIMSVDSEMMEELEVLEDLELLEYLDKHEKALES